MISPIPRRLLPAKQAERSKKKLNCIEHEYLSFNRSKY